MNQIPEGYINARLLKTTNGHEPDEVILINALQFSSGDSEVDTIFSNGESSTLDRNNIIVTVNEALTPEQEQKLDDYINGLLAECKDLDEFESRIDEGILGSIVGGVAGFAFGKTIGEKVAKALGIERGILYDLLTSRLFGTAIGASIGKNI